MSKMSLKTIQTVQLYGQFGAEQLILYNCTVLIHKLGLDNVSANQRPSLRSCDQARAVIGPEDFCRSV